MEKRLPRASILMIDLRRLHRHIVEKRRRSEFFMIDAGRLMLHIVEVMPLKCSRRFAGHSMWVYSEKRRRGQF